MNYHEFKKQEMKKTFIAAIVIIGSMLLAGTVKAQQAPLPDTVVNIKTTNNQLYKLNQLYQFTSSILLKSDISVKDYVEYQKEYQELLNAWFKQKEEQIKAAVKQPAKK